ncbi:MAG: hypothetical protein WAW54_14885 [Parvibaculum sedimenti]|uniref:hypothetical protein n=1 Tax=Parvibaculum sedimenti TaxID=2608632 RepID=UPI003BB7B16E
MPAVDLTSTWIPLGILGVLLLYMIHLFLQERRISRELLAAEAVAPATPEPIEAPAVAAPVVEAAPVEAKVAEPVSEKPTAKRSLVWRTAWIWLPFLIGVGGQAYLDHKPLIDPLLQKAMS